MAKVKSKGIGSWDTSVLGLEISDVTLHACDIEVKGTKEKVSRLI